MREWRRRNPERWKAIEERYWERKAAKEDIAEERKIEQSKK